jgi:inosose dehydratase
MGNIPLGQGVVGIPTIIEELKRIGFDGPTTLEVAGEDNVKASLSSLHQWIGT